MPAVTQNDIVLETARFRIRTLSEADATETYAGWLEDEQVTRFMDAGKNRTTVASLAKFISSFDNRETFILGIFDKDNGSHIGNFTLKVSLAHELASFGILIGERDYWGQKVPAECIPALLDFLFDELSIFKVCVEVSASNLAPIHNYLEGGWTPDGSRKKHVIYGGKRVDMLHFAMFRDDWYARRDQKGMRAAS